MARIERAGFAPVTPLVAQRLWLDTGRWATFVDGFGHVLEKDRNWPEPRSKVVWQSGPAGRGRVTERIRESADGFVATDVFDAQMAAIQAIRFEPAEDGCDVVLSLDYTLARGGPHLARQPGSTHGHQQSGQRGAAYDRDAPPELAIVPVAPRHVPRVESDYCTKCCYR